jgi:chromosome segregation ATPase
MKLERKTKIFAMWIGEARQKSGVSPVSFLTPEAIESVDAYLQLLKNKHGKLPKFIWCSSKLTKHISNEGLNKKLRRLVTKTNIKTGKKNVHFHCIRKFTLSRLRRIDKDMAKIICGKSVSVSDMTYEEIEDQAEKVFRLAYKNLALNGDLTGKNKQKQQEQIDKLENAVITLNRDLQGYKTTAETLTQKLEETEDELQQVLERLQERNLEVARLEEKLEKTKQSTNKRLSMIESVLKKKGILEDEKEES